MPQCMPTQHNNKKEKKHVSCQSTVNVYSKIRITYPKVDGKPITSHLKMTLSWNPTSKHINVDYYF
jgi:hypothetical protein